MKGIPHNEIKTFFLEDYQEWCLLSYGYLKDMDGAEDVVQDVFVKILSRSEKKEILHLKSYITAMVRNSSISRLKQLKRVVPLNQEDLQAIAYNGDEEAYTIGEMELKVQYSLESLPEQRRKVVELCVVEGLKYETAANELGISINTVKYHLKKAFKTLRVTLRKVHLFTPIFHISIYFCGIF